MNQTEIRDWENRTGNLLKKDLYEMALISEIRMYEHDLPEGPVLDVGVGLGIEAIYFSESKREVYAVDKEKYFLDRINRISKGKIITIESKLPSGSLPDKIFALVILSNILHFLDYKDSLLVCNKVANHISSGSYLIVRVHSKKHPYAKKTHKKNSRFNHFFGAAEVKSLFPLENFEIIYFSDYQRTFSQKELSIMGLEKKEQNSKGGYTMIVRKK